MSRGKVVLMTVALLSIGTELTRGQLTNENAAWLARQFAELGFEVTEILTVDDSDQNIVGSLHRLANHHDIIVSTGGLGPTSDDRTSSCVARLLDVPLQLDPTSLEQIRRLFEARGMPFSPTNEKQARFPRGALVLSNSRGTAPGFLVRIQRCSAFFLPGVPMEMRAMFQEQVAHQLPSPPSPPAVRVLRSYGVPESKLAELLADLEPKYEVTLGYRASRGEVEIKIFAKSQNESDKEKAESRAQQVADIVEARVGTAIYSRTEETLAAHVGGLLQDRGLTIGLAESCTGGLVSQLLTQNSGASNYYLGGVCSYANSVKEGLLGVLPKSLSEHGAVSEQVAREMAIGAQRILGTDVALSLTGIAGPGGGTVEKPVGLVHWAVIGGDEVIAEHQVFPGSRAQVQMRSALAGLWSVRQMLHR